jgi:hypothetical protein
VTYGLGARGFNQYDGTVEDIKLRSITTFGDGSIGIQVSKPIGSVEVVDGIVTHGSVGSSLVKGALMQLSAIAFSIKPGGEVKELIVKSSIETYGDNVNTFTVEGGKLSAINIEGSIVANGRNSNAIVVNEGGSTSLTNVNARARSGKALIVDGGIIFDRSGFTEG